MSDKESPELIAYRLKLLETKFDTLAEKFDALRDALQKSACPAPGTCLALADSLKRLETIVSKQEDRLGHVEGKVFFARGAIWASGIAGTMIGSGIALFMK